MTGPGRFTHNLILVLAVMSLAVGTSLAATANTRLRVEYSRPGRSAKAKNNANIVVWLTPLTEPALAEAEKTMRLLPKRYRLTQRRKSFIPHLLVIPAGSVVDFPNKDPFFHNVFSLFDGRRFDLGLYEAGASRGVRFNRLGVSFIFCNIHPQMSAIVITLKTPYFGISDQAGNVSFNDVPSGRYRLEVWAERSRPESLRPLIREVVVSEEKKFLGVIVVRESGDLLSGHKNKYGRDYEPVTPRSPGYQQPD